MKTSNTSAPSYFKELSVTPIRQVIDSYLSAISVDNFRPRYVSFQRTRLGYFEKFVTEKNPGFQIADLSRESLREFLASMQDRKVRYVNHPMRHMEQPGKLSPGYIHGCGRAVKAFCSWAFREKYLAENALAGYTLPKIPKRKPIPLTKEQIPQVLDATLQTLEWERNYALVSLMFDSGLRVEEVSDLEEPQILMEKCQMIIYGKGDKQRMVPFGREVRVALLKYKAVRPKPVDPHDRHFFLTNDGYLLQVNAIEKLYQKLRKIAKIPTLKPHLARHTFAILFLKAGGSLAVLKEILGHESIMTTQRYVNLSDDDIKDGYVQFSPMDQIAPGRRRRPRPSNPKR